MNHKNQEHQKHQLTFYILLFIYRWLMLPLMLTGMGTIGILFSPKVRKSFQLRREARQKSNFPSGQGNQSPIWIHAASGEFEYAKPVLRELKHLHPQIPLLVTFFSPSYVLNIQSTPEVDGSEPLPIDTPTAIQEFLQKWNPRTLLIARTDLWPEILIQCQKRKIKTILFSATFTEQKLRSWGRRLILKWLLPLLSEIHVVGPEDEKALTRLGLRPLRDSVVQPSIQKYYVTGDTRYDQVLYRKHHPRPLKSELRPSEPLLSQTLVAGSTWPQDEKILLPALTPLIIQKKLSLILAPHEPHEAHLKQLKKDLDRFHCSYQLYSQAQQWQGDEVLIIDQVGILADLYPWGSLAFVGGSFRRTVHSVMEPLSSGNLTFVGPLHTNNREALDFKFIPALNLNTPHVEVESHTPPLSMVEVVHSPNDFQDRLNVWISKSTHQKNEIKTNILNHIQQKQGASLRVTHSILEKV